MVKLKSPGQEMQGSFGIPEELSERLEKKPEQSDRPSLEAEKEEAVTKVEQKEEPYSEFDELLKGLGISFTKEDFGFLLAKGYLEKELVVIKGYMTATVRTLTGKHWDDVDELLAWEAKNLDMTMEGSETRRAVWSLSYSIMKLNGTLLSKEEDPKEAALQRRKKLLDLAPAITNKLIKKHGALTRLVTLAVDAPEEHLKNS